MKLTSIEEKLLHLLALLFRIRRQEELQVQGVFPTRRRMLDVVDAVDAVRDDWHS